ncbi:GIP [Symbiodinium pilosum]|uniref:GIP protein n=1 Tax=Symbiodinium pilosum TaxID=2952 RepID=A0A812SDN7_SYMPI|nr:GIP [Symbiodinium pilosum]
MSAVGLARVFTWRLAETNFYLAMSMLAIVLVPATNLAFRKTPPQIDGTESESSIWPLLSTSRIMSGPFGVIAGVFGAMVAYEPMASFFGADIGLLTAAGFGYLLGLAYGLATDKVLEKPAGKWSVAAGTLAALGTSLLVHWAVGVIVGSVVGSVTGALIERRVMKEMDAQCLEPPRFTKNVMQSSPTMGPVSNVVAAMRDKDQQEVQIHTNLPTLYKAFTPQNQLTRVDSGYGSGYDNFEKEQTQLPFASQPALTAPDSPELALQDGTGSQSPSRLGLRSRDSEDR